MSEERTGRGVFTFLFTDLVDSTQGWEQGPTVMGQSIFRQFELIEHEMRRHDGQPFKRTGDGVAGAFTLPSDAVVAACAMRESIRDLDPAEGGLPFRVGMNTGEAEIHHGDYYGSAVNLASRIMDLASGGQIIASETTVLMARSSLADHMTFQDLGRHWLKGFRESHALYQVDDTVATQAFPPISIRTVDQALPPLASTSFIGRAAELASMGAAVGEDRLRTLVGAGGVGKTRVAQEFARRVAPSFPGGVWWCALAPITEAPQIAHTVANVLGVSPDNESVVEGLVSRIGDEALLLMLDNCEHQIEPVRELVAVLLERCQRCCILVTSREALRVPGENVQVIEPLGCDLDPSDGIGPAIELFRDRARAAGATLDDSAAAKGRLARLCERLDGLPLAIELAAARTRSMTIDELANGMDERFLLLANRGGLHQRDERHRTLERTVEWSFDLLDDQQRRLVEVLSVFAGGFDLTAAQDVAERAPSLSRPTTDSFIDLVDKSLIIPDTTGSTTRFSMLETVREYSFGRLKARGVADDVLLAHAHHFCEVAEHAERERAGQDERVWIEVQQRDFDNLRAAVQYALQHGDLDVALRIYLALYELASFQGRVEIFEWLDPNHYLGSNHELAPAALAMAGLRHDPFRQVSLETVLKAIELHNRQGGADHRIYSFALGFAEASRGSTSAAIEAYQDSADVIQATEGENGRWIIARFLAGLVNRPRSDAQELLVDARRVGQPTCIAFSLLGFARSLANDDARRALELVEEAREVAQSVYNQQALVYVDIAAAAILDRSGDTDVVLSYLERALGSAAGLRQHEAMWRSLEKIVRVLRQSGQDDAADRIVRPWIEAFPGPPTRLHAFVSVSEASAILGGPKSINELVAHTREIIRNLAADA